MLLGWTVVDVLVSSVYGEFVMTADANMVDEESDGVLDAGDIMDSLDTRIKVCCIECVITDGDL